MTYTHVIIAHPDLEALLPHAGWDLVGEIRTTQAVTFAFASADPLLTTEVLGIFAAAPQIWHIYGNCQCTHPRQPSSNL